MTTPLACGWVPQSVRGMVCSSWICGVHKQVVKTNLQLDVYRGWTFLSRAKIAQYLTSKIKHTTMQVCFSAHFVARGQCCVCTMWLMWTLGLSLRFLFFHCRNRKLVLVMTIITYKDMKKPRCINEVWRWRGTIPCVWDRYFTSDCGWRLSYCEEVWSWHNWRLLV